MVGIGLKWRKENENVEGVEVGPIPEVVWIKHRTSRRPACVSMVRRECEVVEAGPIPEVVWIKHGLEVESRKKRFFRVD